MAGILTVCELLIGLDKTVAFACVLSDFNDAYGRGVVYRNPKQCIDLYTLGLDAPEVPPSRLQEISEFDCEVFAFKQIMVVLSANIEDVAPVPCELKLESGRFIRYVAAKDANPRKEIVGRGVFESIGLPQRRKSSASEGALRKSQYCTIP
ncbi:hypothetical protein GCK32_008739 [Trichostrongylus colubriformis]|uniref:Uncharacterized protein n=1 Tax=Trichostrongylus colubriformis TaxID=6319 RepID=A0AAN8FUS9_TRICO